MSILLPRHNFASACLKPCFNAALEQQSHVSGKLVLSHLLRLACHHVGSDDLKRYDAHDG